MKKLVLITGLFLTLTVSTPVIEAQDSKPAAGFVITLSAENAGTGWIYLSRREKGMFVDVDSARSGVYPVILKGKQDIPELLYLRISGSNKLVPVFTENSSFTVAADFNDPGNTQVNGSSVHKTFDDYSKGLNAINAELESLPGEWSAAQKAGDSEKLKSIRAKEAELEKSAAIYSREFVLKHLDSYVSPYIIRREMFYTLDLEDLKNLVSLLDQSVSNSVYTIDLKEKIAALEKVAPGQKFTELVLTDLDDKSVKLSGFLGKNVVLVDFWASWCGPCRRENPEVVKIYEEYKSKGFDIVGVSFDRNKKDWEQAVKKDQLVWHHMSDLKGWNSIAAELYAIASIPNSILIDRDGTIIAKNLHGDELRAKLDELLD